MGSRGRVGLVGSWGYRRGGRFGFRIGLRVLLIRLRRGRGGRKGRGPGKCEVGEGGVDLVRSCVMCCLGFGSVKVSSTGT